MNISFGKEDYLLTPERAIIHLNTFTAFIADLHLGKSAHFRKSGIAIPSAVIQRDLESIESLISKYSLRTIYFLGDLFHSHINKEWLLLEKLINSYLDVEFHLIKGNHDILPDDIYQASRLLISNEPYLWRDISLSHHPVDKQALKKDIFNFAGHIHPGTILKGKARNSIKLPCFLVSKNQIILPAFGRFTGTVIDKERKLFTKYALSENKVFKIE